MKVTDKLMLKAVSDAGLIIIEIQELLSTFAREFKLYCLERGIMKETMNLKMFNLVRAIDSQIEDRLIRMYLKSIEQFMGAMEYMCLGMTLDRHDNADFNLHLSPAVYFMRHQAMTAYSMVPLNMSQCLHPNRLMARLRPDLMRRASFIGRAVMHITEMAVDSSAC